MTMEISINEFVKGPAQARYFNFYDWFCDNSSLKNRVRKFIPKLKFLVKEGVLNGDTMYAWFKNNCPIYGELYDDMRFSSMTVEYGLDGFRGGIAPKQGYDNNKSCNVWFFIGNDDDRELVQYEYANWMTFKKLIKNDKNSAEYFSKGYRGELTRKEVNEYDKQHAENKIPNR